MNPHYAFSVLFALGLHGIKNKMELTIPPTSQVKPAAHGSTYERLPKDLYTANERFKAPDSLARVCVKTAKFLPTFTNRQCRVLGDMFVDHFAATREHEWMIYSQTVTGRPIDCAIIA